MRVLLPVLLAAVVAVSCSKSNPVAPTPPVTNTGLVLTGDTSFTDFNQVSQLTATLTLSNNTAQDQTLAATWTSSNIAVASVSATGVVRAITSGTSQITATFAGLTGSKTTNVTIACQVNNTASLTFGNRSAATRQVVVWDGIGIFTLAPGETSPPYTVVAGVPHTLVTRNAVTNALACSQASPVLVQCSNGGFTCSG